MLPVALAGAAHDEQVAPARGEGAGGAAAVGAHEEAPRFAQRDGGHEGAVAAVAAGLVAVPGHAVAPVAVEREGDGIEGAPVARAEGVGDGAHDGVAGAVAGDGGGEARHLHHAVVHEAAVAVPARVIAQGGEERLVPGEEALRLVDPGVAPQHDAAHAREGGVEGGAFVAEQGGLADGVRGHRGRMVAEHKFARQAA